MALQNSLNAPLPLAVDKGGTGNTTPTFSSGPLTVGTVGYRAPDGTVSSPAYSFTNNTDTGIYNSSGNIKISSLGTNVADFSHAVSGNKFTLKDNDGDNTLSLYTNDSTNAAFIEYTASSSPISGITFQNSGDITLGSPTAITLNAPAVGVEGGLIVAETVTVNTGPLTVNTVGYRAPNGTAASPAYSFTGSTDTGIFKISNDMGISSNGILVSLFSGDPNFSVLGVTGSSSNLVLKIDNTTNKGSITCTEDLTIDVTTGDVIIDTDLNVTGSVTLTNALAIDQGGTSTTTAAQAIKNLMPTATVNGTLAYYNGTNWVIVAPPAAGTYFLKIISGGTGTGGTPFWSLV